MTTLPALGRALALLVIATGMALAAAVMIGGIWLDLDSSELLRLASWLLVGAAISLTIGVVLLLAVDRAADGRYVTRLAISGILTSLVFVLTIGIAVWRLELYRQERARWWLVLGFSAGIAALFALLAAWLDARPVRAAAYGALDIAQGNYRARLPETGNDEVAQFSTAVNLLASRAQSSAIRQSNQDRARENLLLAITGDAQLPIDNLRALTISLSSPQQIDPTRLHRYVDALDREIGALQRRLDEVEEIARLESGQVTLRLQPVSLSQMLIAVSDRLQPGASTRNVIISPRVDFSAPPVLADPDQTFRALEALLSYALSEIPDRSQLAVEIRDAGQFVQMAAIEIPEDGEAGAATRIEWESAHRRRESALSLAVAGRLIEHQGGSFLISRGHAGAPIVVVSLPKS